jgi:hypothetical protein
VGRSVADKALQANQPGCSDFYVGLVMFDPKECASRADIQRAVQLDPSDPLFLDSAAYRKAIGETRSRRSKVGEWRSAGSEVCR